MARVTSPGYLTGLTALPMEQVRAMRAECQGLENALSYVRRVAQGRLDIVGAELARRRAGGDPTDLSELIGRLPDILADRTQARSGVKARPPLDFAGDASGEEYSAEIDATLRLGVDPYNYDVNYVTLSMRYRFGGSKTTAETEAAAE